MHLSKNSRYVWQKTPWLSTNLVSSCWKQTNRCYSAKVPKDDPTKPPLRLNIPKDPAVDPCQYALQTHTDTNTSRGGSFVRNHFYPRSKSLVCRSITPTTAVPNAVIRSESDDDLHRKSVLASKSKDCLSNSSQEGVAGELKQGHQTSSQIALNSLLKCATNESGIFARKSRRKIVENYQSKHKRKSSTKIETKNLSLPKESRVDSVSRNGQAASEVKSADSIGHSELRACSPKNESLATHSSSSIPLKDKIMPFLSQNTSGVIASTTAIANNQQKNKSTKNLENPKMVENRMDGKDKDIAYPEKLTKNMKNDLSWALNSCLDQFLQPAESKGRATNATKKIVVKEEDNVGKEIGMKITAVEAVNEDISKDDFSEKEKITQGSVNITNFNIDDLDTKIPDDTTTRSIEKIVPECYNIMVSKSDAIFMKQTTFSPLKRLPSVPALDFDVFELSEEKCPVTLVQIESNRFGEKKQTLGEKSTDDQIFADPKIVSLSEDDLVHDWRFNLSVPENSEADSKEYLLSGSMTRIRPNSFRYLKPLSKQVAIIEEIPEFLTYPECKYPGFSQSKLECEEDKSMLRRSVRAFHNSSRDCLGKLQKDNNNNKQPLVILDSMSKTDGSGGHVESVSCKKDDSKRETSETFHQKADAKSGLKNIFGSVSAESKSKGAKLNPTVQIQPDPHKKQAPEINLLSTEINRLNTTAPADKKNRIMSNTSDDMKRLNVTKDNIANSMKSGNLQTSFKSGPKNTTAPEFEKNALRERDLTEFMIGKPSEHFIDGHLIKKENSGGAKGCSKGKNLSEKSSGNALCGTKKRDKSFSYIPRWKTRKTLVVYPSVMTKLTGEKKSHQPQLNEKEKTFTENVEKLLKMQSATFEMNPKCTNKYKTHKTPSKTKMVKTYLTGKDVIINVSKSSGTHGPRISDNIVNVANEDLARSKENPSVDSLRMMKKVKEMLNLDLDNAVKIFVSSKEIPKEVISSTVICSDKNEWRWKINQQQLSECINLPKKRSGTSAVCQVRENTWQVDETLIEQERLKSKSSSGGKSTVKFDATSSRFFVDNTDLEAAISKSATDDPIKSSVASQSSVKITMGMADSDSGSLKTGSENSNQAEALDKPHTPKQEDKIKPMNGLPEQLNSVIIFNPGTNQFKLDQPSLDNAVKLNCSILKPNNASAVVWEMGSFNVDKNILKKLQSEKVLKNTIVYVDARKPTEENSSRASDILQNTKQGDSILFYDDVKKTWKVDLSLIKGDENRKKKQAEDDLTERSEKILNEIEEKERETAGLSKIPPPHTSNEKSVFDYATRRWKEYKNETVNPSKNVSDGAKKAMEKTSTERQNKLEEKQKRKADLYDGLLIKDMKKPEASTKSTASPSSEKNVSSARSDSIVNEDLKASQFENSERTEISKVKPIDILKKVETVTRDESNDESSASKKQSNHYVSKNILNRTKTNVERVSKIKENKGETVRLNMTATKRSPSKIKEINLKKNCDDAKDGKDKNTSKIPKEIDKADKEKPEKKEIDSKNFYSKFEKYKSPFSEPDYEDKPIKINSDIKSNPNLKKLDGRRKTIVLHDVSKPQDSVDSWLRDETDKMTTLLLKVLQEASEGKPRRPSHNSCKVSDKARGSPYNSIRKKQETNYEQVVYRVRTSKNAGSSMRERTRQVQRSKSVKETNVTTKPKTKTSSKNVTATPLQSDKNIQSSKIIQTTETTKITNLIPAATETVRIRPKPKSSPPESEREITPEVCKVPEKPAPVKQNASTNLNSLKNETSGVSSVKTTISPEMQDSSIHSKFPKIEADLQVEVLRPESVVLSTSSLLVREEAAYKEKPSFVDEIPGPEVLKKLSAVWRYLPQMGCQATISLLWGILRLVNLGVFLAGSSNRSKVPQRPFDGLFSKYGPMVKLHSPFGGEIVLLNKPEHISAVYNMDRKIRSKSSLDSIEKCRRPTQGDLADISRHLTGIQWEQIRKENDLARKGVENFFEPIEAAATLMVKKIRTLKDRHDEVLDDFMPEINNWSLECLCCVAFGKPFGFLNHQFKTWTSEPKRLLRSMNRATEDLCKCESGFQLWRLINTPSSKSLGQACQTIDGIITKYIRLAQANLTKRKDHTNDNNASNLSLIEGMLLQKMTNEEIAATILDMLLIGVNSTSSSLGFLLYHLAVNHRAQKILLKEIKDVLPEKNSRLEYRQLHSLKYLQACLKESLRLNMPMPSMIKVLPEEMVLSNYRIPKGTYVVVDTQISCMKEQNFDEPEKFIPERWFDMPTMHHPFVSLPFSHGPIAGFGKRLAEIELWSCAAKIIRNFRVDYNYSEIQGTNDAISFPDKPLKLTFIEREA